MIRMELIEWNVSDLGDDSCLFSICNYIEEDLFYYLRTIQQYILQFGDYSVISFAVVVFWDDENKNLDIITDFPFSKFMELNLDWTTAIQKKIE